MVDGRAVYDFTAGAQRAVTQPGAPDDVQVWAAWAPDSAHYARVYDPSSTVVVATPDGTQLRVPVRRRSSRSRERILVAGGWLDDRTLLVAYASILDSTLDVHTWTIGDGSWRAAGC